jgi:hypothetical protein
MLLETWLTTHASSSVSGLTETGPQPDWNFGNQTRTAWRRYVEYGKRRIRRVHGKEARAVHGKAHRVGLRLLEIGEIPAAGAWARVFIRDDRTPSTARSIAVPIAFLANVACLTNDIQFSLLPKSVWPQKTSTGN